MSATARELLTRIPTSDGAPLFKNAQDLGRRIAQVPPHPNEAAIAVLLSNPARISNRYFNRPKQAGNFLNMVLGGVKPCPTPLRELIAICIRERLGPDRIQEAESWITRVNAALSEQHASEREAKLGGSQSYAITQFLEDASEVLVARPNVHDEFELRADLVINHCFRRQGLARPRINSEEIRLTVCLESAEMAAREGKVMLDILRSRVANEAPHGRSEFEAKLRTLIEQDYIRVVAVSNAPTVIPFVAFELSEPDRMSAFCYAVDRSGKAGFLQLPRPSCFAIQLAFLPELKAGAENILKSMI